MPDRFRFRVGFAAAGLQFVPGGAGAGRTGGGRCRLARRRRHGGGEFRLGGPGIDPGAADEIFVERFHPEDQVGGPLGDRFPHRFEQPHPFPFVFDLGVELGVPFELDAAAEVIHRQEVIFPRLVNDVQEHLPFHPAHFGVELVIDRAIDEDFQLLAGHPGEVFGRGLEPQFRVEFVSEFGDRRLLGGHGEGRAGGAMAGEEVGDLAVRFFEATLRVVGGVLAELDQLGLQFVAVQHHVVDRQIDAETSQQPARQPFAIEMDLLPLPCGEGGEAGEDRVFAFFFGIGLFGAIDQQVGDGAVVFDAVELIGGHFDAELVADPAAERAAAEGLFQQGRPFGEVGGRDLFLGLYDEVVDQLFAGEFLQVAIGVFGAEAGVGHVGQRLPVPILFGHFLGEALFDRFDHGGFCGPFGLVTSVFFGDLELDAAEILRFERAAELGAGVGGEAVGPVVGIEERLDVLLGLAADLFQDQFAATDAVEDLLAEAIDSFPLFVHDLVVFEEALADFEVPLFDLFLCGGDAAGDELRLDRFAFLHPQPFHPALHEIAREDPHQVVFQRQVEAAAAGVPLASAAAAELEVDAA